MIFTETRIKNDLKSLKYFNNSVKIYERASSYFKEQYEMAKKNGMLTGKEMEGLEKCINLIDSNTFVNQTVELKERYLNAIAKLDDITKAIILDAFVNSASYVDISRKMYCSVETVKRRVKSGIYFIMEQMNSASIE